MGNSRRFFGVCVGIMAVIVAASADPTPTMPLKFSATIQTTAHQIEEGSEYPLRVKTYKVKYDFPNKRSVIEYVDTGHTYVKRYDEKWEGMYKSASDYSLCQKSEIKDDMPKPAYPDDLEYGGQEKVRGIDCHRWTQDFGESQIDIYESVADKSPVRIVYSKVEEREPLVLSEPLMTYDLSNFKKASTAIIPSSYEKICEPVPNNIGFPYTHLLHTYIRV